MGKKGKGKQIEQQQFPKKKTMITQEQLMDKTHMDKTDFIPLLPSQSLYPPFIFNSYNQAALQKITSDLNYLLYVQFKTFWATLLYSPSLRNCLSSCLTHLHRRWLNTYIYSQQTEEQFQTDQKHRQQTRTLKQEQSYEYSQGLMQVLLLIYHRMVSFNQQNQELSILYKIGDQISRKYLLDIPRLLELCQIYGPSNPQIIKYIVKMYANTLPDFYRTLTNTLLPLFKRTQDTFRIIKSQTDRQEYGINYNYKRLAGQQLSQGEEQLKKKTIFLMQFLGLLNTINCIIQYFPQDCVDHCYFNSQIQFLLQNIFLQLQVAYKVWNYQTQDVKMLGMINSILKQCIDYFVNYFNRCYNFIINKKKTPNIQAYVVSLERIFKDFGRRFTISKKNTTRYLLLYKIIQKHFDLHSMLHTLYKNELQNNQYQFNLQELKDIIITFDNQFKEEYINEDEPRQEEIQEQTQAENEDQNEDENLEEQQHEEEKQKPGKTPKTQQQKDLSALQMLIPKRMRSEDYYTKLYADFNKKFYKGQYEDDYDQIADYDKRPLFYDQQSSDSESQSQIQKHLVSNTQYVEQINSKHRHTVNRDDLRLKNVNQPKFGRIQQTSNNNSDKGKKYVEKGEKGEQPSKKKYVAKNIEQIRQEDQQEHNSPHQRTQYRQKQQKEQTPQKRGGQGYKKSNKSYSYKPKEHHNNERNDKGRNTNKTKASETKYK